MLENVKAVEVIWEALKVEKNDALDFIAVFARFEYALKRTDFLMQTSAAQADWDKFARGLAQECSPDQIEMILKEAPYLSANPTKKQTVSNGSLAWEDENVPTTTTLDWLLKIVRRTRNNLFHGGKFAHGPVSEPLRDARLIRESTTVLLQCLQTDCDSARRVHDAFWRFDAE